MNVTGNIVAEREVRWYGVGTMQPSLDAERSADPATARDGIDETLEQWARTFPELDIAPLGVILRISRLGLLFSGNLQRFLRPYGIGAGEMDVLFQLLQAGPPYEQRPSDISRRCHVTTGATTGRVNRLIAAGLAERETSARDRRELLVRLTGRGRAMAEQIRNDVSHTEAVAEALDAMGPDDRAAFIRLLRIFTGRIQQSHAVT